MSDVSSLAEKRGRGRDLAAVALPGLAILLGVALRFYDLGAESYWVDEVTMVRVAGDSVESILQAAQNGRPPVYVLAAHYWLQLFGPSEGTARALSAVFGSAALVVTYLVARELFGRQVGAITTFLMAVSEFQIYVSQDLRYYSLFLLFVLLSFLFLVRAERYGGRGDFALYAATSILMFYTHTYGVFVLAAQGLYLVLRFLWRWHGLSGVAPWFFSLGAVFLAVSPGLYLAFGKTASGSANVLQWIPDPTFTKVAATIYKYLLPARELPHLLTVATAAAFFAASTWLFARRAGEKRWRAAVQALPTEARRLVAGDGGTLLLVGLWLLFPIAVPLALSMVFGPMFVERYTIAATPAFYMALAVGITALRRVVPAHATLGLLAILIAPGLHDYYATDVKEQWREVAAHVEAEARPGDAIVFAPGENGALRWTFGHYYRGSTPQCDIPTEATAREAIAGSLAVCAPDAQRLWLVVRGLPYRVRPYEEYFRDDGHRGGTLVDERRFTDIAVYLFQQVDSQAAGASQR